MPNQPSLTGQPVLAPARVVAGPKRKKAWPRGQALS